MDEKSILEMSQGAILERVNYEMRRVIDNVLDVNTRADAKRKLTVTLELTPDAQRQMITVKTTAKSMLVPTEPIMTGLVITGRPNTGEMVVAEMVPQIPGQIDMYGGEQDSPKILKLAREA